MIKYNYEVSVNENRAKLNKDIFLFRGNRNIHYYFSIKGARFAFEKEGDLIENANAIYAAVTVIKPNGVEVANAIAPVENGLIHLKVTEDLIDEEVEIGDFDLVFDLFDDSDGAVTIPKIKGQFHVQERPCTTSIGTLSGNVNVVNQAVVDLAIATQENEQLIVVDDDGKYVKTTWAKGNKISIERLNKMEEGIYNNSSQLKDIVNKIAQGGLGIVFENVEDGEVFTSIKEVIECTSISLDKTELSFTNTIPQTLIATVLPSNTTEKVTWSINDESIVVIVDGTVTPKKNGNTIITATCGNKTATCNVAVTGIITNYSIVNNLTNCINSNSATSIEENSSYTATITANKGCTLGEVTCTMGGVSQTVTDGAISIENVTGNIIITAKATTSSIVLPSDDSDKFYIQDGYAYIDPRTLDNHKITSMAYDDTSDTEKATVSFSFIPANRYEKTSEVLFNNFIPYNDTSATSYYYFNNTAIYAKIPRSEYVNAGSDINRALYNMFIRLPIKLLTVPTSYPLTDDIIDSMTGSVNTNTNENGYYNGFINLPSGGLGFEDTGNVFCNKLGAISNILLTDKEDYAIKITTRFYYNIASDKFPNGFTLDSLKTYLKSLGLVFYV